MAGQIPDLNATVRAGTGKGAARQARREGNIPGIVYGGESDPLPINIPFNVLLKRRPEGGYLLLAVSFASSTQFVPVQR